MQLAVEPLSIASIKELKLPHIAGAILYGVFQKYEKVLTIFPFYFYKF